MTPTPAGTRRAAQALYRLGARRVWLCGSIARAGRWDERSDVDFAVEGLPASRLAEARGTTARLTGRPVNVVPLEDAPPSLRAGILSSRILVDPDGNDHGAGPATRPEPPPPPASPSLAMAPLPWHERRLATVASTLTGAGARRIVDFGCGAGRLIELLALAGAERLTGIDRDADTLARTRSRLGAALPPATMERITLRHGTLSTWDDDLAGHDAAVAVEVIEHLDPADLTAFADVVFGRLRPSVAVFTTPNAEFNTLMKSVDLRHPEHRFEWSRAQARAWAAGVGAEYGYRATVAPLGRTFPGYGPITVMAVFRVCPAGQSTS